VELGRIYRLREQGSLWSFRCHFGKELLDSGRAAEAEREFGIAVAIADRYPEDVQVQNGVAWELAGSSTMLDAALRFGRRAVEILPDNGNIWDTLGAVYFKRGEMKEAIEAQTRAVALSPDNDEFKQKLEEWKAESGNR